MKLLLFILLLQTFDSAFAFCVLDSKKGWWLDCGIRDSYLFRIKDLGGLQANFDLGFGFGDEDGFPNSISKTNKKAKAHYHPTVPDGYHANAHQGDHNAHPHPYRRSDGPRWRNRRKDFPYPYDTPPSLKLTPPKVGRSQALPRNQPGFQYPHTRGSPSIQSPLRRSQGRLGNFSTRSSWRRDEPTTTTAPPSRKWWNWWWKKPEKPQPKPKRRMSWFWKPKRPSARPRPQRKPRPPVDSRNDFEWLPLHTSPFSDVHLPQPPSGFHQQAHPFGFSHPTEAPFVFHLTTTARPTATVGVPMSKLLNVSPSMPANSDNVPSFAAKMFIVREAPAEFFPPNYDGIQKSRPRNLHVEIPRTKFYCEDQKYLPGIYADSMLGCKMFHLCVPSFIGSSLTSYLCPNGTLFDQSILQCNHWYAVDCESSVKDYDANLALALSYRRINAAHLPLQAASDVSKLSLLSQNMNQLKVPNPKKKKKSRLTNRLGRFLAHDGHSEAGNNVSRTRNLTSHPEEEINSYQWSLGDLNVLKDDVILKIFDDMPQTLENNTSKLNILSRNYSDPSKQSFIKASLDGTSPSLKSLIQDIQTKFKGREDSGERSVTGGNHSIAEDTTNHYVIPLTLASIISPKDNRIEPSDFLNTGKSNETWAPNTKGL